MGKAKGVGVPTPEEWAEVQEVGRKVLEENGHDIKFVPVVEHRKKAKEKE